MRFRLRTLLLAVTILPPIAGFGYLKWKRDVRTRAIIELQQQYFAEQQKLAAARHARYLVTIQRIRQAGEIRRAKFAADAQQAGRYTRPIPSDQLSNP